tara:strand:- start:342 stop:1370 length:1029 start_codon:yes stop_codon:yes gene_type:complete
VNKSKIISSYAFASIADVIFCGLFMKSQVNSLKLKNNIQSYFGPSEYTFIRQKEFQLNENDIIFCKSEHIFELFYLLRKNCYFKNIKLITHQSDMKITKRIYKLKPKCISEWYSINVDTKQKDLIPIPIGVANFHSKNLNEKMFEDDINLGRLYFEKSNLFYLNFNQNTNFNHRKGLFDYFSHEQNTTIRKDNIGNENYLSELQQHNFTLAPWGNGIDTHRFWESLYSGSIPVTKKHINFSSFKSIPFVLVDDYKKINTEFLQEEFKKIQNSKNKYTFEELDINYWEEKIKSNKINRSLESINIFHNRYSFYRKKERYKHLLKSKLKIFNRYRRIIYKMLKI